MIPLLPSASGVSGSTMITDGLATPSGPAAYSTTTPHGCGRTAAISEGFAPSMVAAFRISGATESRSRCSAAIRSASRLLARFISTADIFSTSSFMVCFSFGGVKKTELGQNGSGKPTDETSGSESCVRCVRADFSSDPPVSPCVETAGSGPAFIKAVRTLGPVAGLWGVGRTVVRVGAASPRRTSRWSAVPCLSTVRGDASCGVTESRVLRSVLQEQVRSGSGGGRLVLGGRGRCLRSLHRRGVVGRGRELSCHRVVALSRRWSGSRGLVAGEVDDQAHGGDV